MLMIGTHPAISSAITEGHHPIPAIFTHFPSTIGFLIPRAGWQFRAVAHQSDLPTRVLGCKHPLSACFPAQLSESHWNATSLP